MDDASPTARCPPSMADGSAAGLPQTVRFGSTVKGMIAKLDAEHKLLSPERKHVSTSDLRHVGALSPTVDRRCVQRPPADTFYPQDWGHNIASSRCQLAQQGREFGVDDYT